MSLPAAHFRVGIFLQWPMLLGGGSPVGTLSSRMFLMPVHRSGTNRREVVGRCESTCYPVRYQSLLPVVSTSLRCILDVFGAVRAVSSTDTPVGYQPLPVVNSICCEHLSRVGMRSWRQRLWTTPRHTITTSHINALSHQIILLHQGILPIFTHPLTHPHQHTLSHHHTLTSSHISTLLTPTPPSYINTPLHTNNPPSDTNTPSHTNTPN